MHRLFAQLKVDLKRLSHIGVPKVIVTNLHPIGCIPSYTRPTNYTACYSNVSSAVAEHNRRVDELMQELGGGSDTTFLSLDVNTAFLNVLHRGLQLRNLARIQWVSSADLFFLPRCSEGSKGDQAPVGAML